METKFYTRKPLMVEAVQVTEDNIYEVAQWCGGDIRTEHGPEPRKYVEVKVLYPVKKEHGYAFPTDWILKSNRGYKIYGDRAFVKSFELTVTYNELPDDVKDALNLAFTKE